MLVLVKLNLTTQIVEQCLKPEQFRLTRTEHNNKYRILQFKEESISEQQWTLYLREYFLQELKIGNDLRRQ